MNESLAEGAWAPQVEVIERDRSYWAGLCYYRGLPALFRSRCMYLEKRKHSLIRTEQVRPHDLS